MIGGARSPKLHSRDFKENFKENLGRRADSDRRIGVLQTPAFEADPHKARPAGLPCRDSFGEGDSHNRVRLQIGDDRPTVKERQYLSG